MKVKVFKLEEISLLNGSKVKIEDVTNVKPKLPVYGKEGDGCMDLYPIYCEYDVNRDRFIYHTGLAFAINDSVISVPDNTNTDIEYISVPNEMEIRPRSNLTKSDFYIPNAPCTLDWGYRGELMIIFKNRTSKVLLDNILMIAQSIDILNNRIAIFVGQEPSVKQIIGSVRSNITAIATNIMEPPYKCDGNDRCAQLIIRGSDRIIWEEVESIKELGVTDRGTKGFGEGTGGAVK